MAYKSDATYNQNKNLWKKLCKILEEQKIMGSQILPILERLHRSVHSAGLNLPVLDSYPRKVLCASYPKNLKIFRFPNAKLIIFSIFCKFYVLNCCLLQKYKFLFIFTYKCLKLSHLTLNILLYYTSHNVTTPMFLPNKLDVNTIIIPL